jgi:hypothetical protein
MANENFRKAAKDRVTKGANADAGGDANPLDAAVDAAAAEDADILETGGVEDGVPPAGQEVSLDASQFPALAGKQPGEEVMLVGRVTGSGEDGSLNISIENAEAGLGPEGAEGGGMPAAASAAAPLGGGNFADAARGRIRA